MPLRSARVREGWRRAGRGPDGRAASPRPFPAAPAFDVVAAPYATTNARRARSPARPEATRCSRPPPRRSTFICASSTGAPRGWEGSCSSGATDRTHRLVGARCNRHLPPHSRHRPASPLGPDSGKSGVPALDVRWMTHMAPSGPFRRRPAVETEPHRPRKRPSGRIGASLPSWVVPGVLPGFHPVTSTALPRTAYVAPLVRRGLRTRPVGAPACHTVGSSARRRWEPSDTCWFSPSPDRDHSAPEWVNRGSITPRGKSWKRPPPRPTVTSPGCCCTRRSRSSPRPRTPSWRPRCSASSCSTRWSGSG